MTSINAIVVAAYLLGMVVLGLYLSRYVRRDEDFFLAGRCLNKWVIAGTVMATNVAAIYLVGPAAAAYSGGGFSVLLIAWTGNMIAAGSALLFVPRLRRLRITTVSEFLEERYGLWLRLLPAMLWIIYYALFSGNAMYTLARVLEPVLDLEINTIIILVGAGVVIYCFLSGLVAVVYSSVIQAFLIILGGLILLPLCLKEVGGISEFARKVPESYFVFWRAGEVWPTYKDVIMFTLLGLPYWCTSQYMLQRAFAGRTVRDASRGILLAALLTGPLTLSYIVPGICGTVIYPADTFSQADAVLPRLIVDFLPVGLAGLLIAGLVAASNSTASALLNSLATLAEHDFYRRFFPNKTSGHYIWVGRIVTLLAGAVGLVFAFNVPRLGGIIQANFEIMSFFEPPIFVIVAAALFWRAVNSWGAGAAIISGVAFNVIAAFGYTFFGYSSPMPAADRTIYAFPICIAAVIIGSFAGNALRPAGTEVSERIDALLSRMRGSRFCISSTSGRTGLILTLVSMVAFVGCAFGEDMLPKPQNLLGFMILMMSFVLGCYIAVPVFVSEEGEPAVEAEKGTLGQSWIHRIFGSGWSWLALYAFALAMVVILYFC